MLGERNDGVAQDPCRGAHEIPPPQHARYMVRPPVRRHDGRHVRRGSCLPTSFTEEL